MDGQAERSQNFCFALASSRGYLNPNNTCCFVSNCKRNSQNVFFFFGRYFFERTADRSIKSVPASSAAPPEIDPHVHKGEITETITRLLARESAAHSWQWRKIWCHPASASRPPPCDPVPIRHNTRNCSSPVVIGAGAGAVCLSSLSCWSSNS